MKGDAQVGRGVTWEARKAKKEAKAMAKQMEVGGCMRTSLVVETMARALKHPMFVESIFTVGSNGET